MSGVAAEPAADGGMQDGVDIASPGRFMKARLPLVLAMVSAASPVHAETILLVREPGIDTAELAARLEESHRVTQWVAAPQHPPPEAARLAATLALESAREAFRELDGDRALEEISRGIVQALPHSDHHEALRLLARLLRLRGRVYLYRGERELAAEAFGAAADWDTEFSPRVEEWPPEARLAYSDARALRLRSAPGAVSVRLQPSCAEVFVDGRSRGRGSTTVRNLAPGLHVLAAACPGYERFGATFEVEGDGTLTEVSIFLPELPDGDAWRARALMESPEQFGPVLASEPFVAVLLVDTERQVRLLRSDGVPIAETLQLDDPALPTILIEKLESRDPPVTRAWYERPWVWIVTGVVVAGAATGAALAASRGDDETVRLVIGR